MTVLIGTLGASWGIIPEIFGALSRRSLLFRNHPNGEHLENLRRECGLATAELEALWILTSEGGNAASSIGNIRQWWKLLAPACELKIWMASGTRDVATLAEIELLRELIYRAVLHGHARFGSRVLLSLAGGRKTMSADMQSAAAFFGCRKLLHVVGPEPLPEEFRKGGPDFWAGELPGTLARLILPALVGDFPPSDLADIPGQGIAVDDLTTQAFPLDGANGPESGVEFRFSLPEGAKRLVENIDQRRRQSHNLLSNFLSSVGREDKRENWRCLYRCPPRVIERLRKARVPDAYEFLRLIPKAELHCHIGGILDIQAQKRVGFSLWERLDAVARQHALGAAAPLLRTGTWPPDWPKVVKEAPGIPPSHVAAALLVRLSAEELDAGLFGPTRPRLGLKDRHALKFDAYALPGDLSGSTLLGDEEACQAYAAEIVQYCAAHRLAYLELRGSPAKYASADPVSWLRAFKGHLDTARLAQNCSSEIAFISIMKREPGTSCREAVQATKALKREFSDFLVGADVAGDESGFDPAALARDFEPLFEACLPITIHAGEGEAVEKIWGAAYRLHADRVGHGLTLADRPELLKRFRERSICVELCPSSNVEVVGFRKQGDPQTASYADYPLREYLDQGLPVAICTDNPGISNTDPANELLVAHHLCGAGGLSAWEALGLIKQAFVSSFLPFARRESLMKRVDGEIFALVMNHFGT